MKIFRESPKLSIAIVISLLLEMYDIFSSNADLFGISSDALAKISVIVTLISVVWKQVKPNESAFKMLARQAHVGTRPTNPPTKPDPKDND